MRSMLISLILLCSLTQLAIANPPNITGCGTTYVCYVPEICTDANLATKPLKDYGVKEVKDAVTVNDDCPAIIRYHLYSTNFIYVSIESFQAKEDVASIKFLHLPEYPRNPSPKQIAEYKPYETFSCNIEKDDDQNDKIIGAFDSDEKSRGDPSSKLLCIFDVNNRGQKPIFHLSYAKEYLQFKIKSQTGVESKTKDKYVMKPEIFAKCDPTNFYFEHEDNTTQLYKKVDFHPGEYFCAEPNYKLQFKKDKTSNYEMVEKIECIDGFKINEKQFGSDDKIYIRCVADTKFYCKYNLKPTINAPVKGPRPDDPVTQESVMECPSEKPHLIIVGKSEPILNPKFECLNFGGDPVWRVSEQTITSDGPEIYCTNEVKCHLIKNNAIPESSVKDGFLGTDFLPRCFTDGKLYVQEIGKPKELVTTKCDGLTGKFKYVVKSGEFVIGQGTKFECEYPRYENHDKNEQNKKTLLTGSLIAGGVAVALAVGIVGIGCFFIRLRVKQERKKIETMNNAAWFHYCADENENNNKNNIKKPKKKTNATLDPGTGESVKWDDMSLSFIHQAQSQEETRDLIGQGRCFSRKMKENNPENVKEGCSIPKTETVIKMEDLKSKIPMSSDARLAVEYDDFVKTLKEINLEQKNDKSKSQKK